MTKKLLISLLTIIVLTLIIFSNNTFGYTSDEIEVVKEEAQELLNAKIKNNMEEITTYYNSLVQTKETLHKIILEKVEGKEELQKLKYSINVIIIRLNDYVKNNSFESQKINQTAYNPNLLGVKLGASRSSRNATLLEFRPENVITGGPISYYPSGDSKIASLLEEPGLFCNQQGAPVTSIEKKNNKMDGEDATLYITTIENPGGKSMGVAAPASVGDQIDVYTETIEGYVEYTGENPTGSDYITGTESTRSIPVYEIAGTITFTEAEAYILAHAGSVAGDDYPNAIQQAFWQNQIATGTSSGSVESSSMGNEDGTGSINTEVTNPIQIPASKLDEERKTAFGNEAENTTNMDECTVQYNFDEHCWYVGPFNLNYERKIENTTGANVLNSQNLELQNEIGNLIEYRGINTTTFYDESGKKLEGVQFVTIGDVQKEYGDEEYEFPYPNEGFYLKIPYTGNETAKKLARMEVETYDMYAEAKGYKLKGVYQQFSWEGYKEATYCGETLVCSCGDRGGTIGEHSEGYWCDTHNSDDCGVDCPDREKQYCEGYAKCSTHGSSGNNSDATANHLFSWRHYVECTGVSEGDAQEEISIEYARIGMRFTTKSIEIGKVLTIKMGGTVFNDLHTGKESDQNGIKDENEKGIEGVKVTITPKAGTIEGETRQTYTDEFGKWSMQNVIVGQYDVEFEYDGQTYKPTKLLNSGDETAGNIEEYIKNPNDKKYLNTSKAQETEEERQAFNNKFYEITETLNGQNELTTGTAIGTEGQRNILDYTMQNRVSKLITRDANTNIPLNLYKMQARTSSNGIWYALHNKIHIENTNKGEYIAIYPYLENINLGLIERAKADFSVNMDIYQAHVRLKDTFQVFTYNARNIDSFEQMKNIENYVQRVNPDDYGWRWDESLSSIYPDRDSSELQVYIDYKIIIRNQSEATMGQITELVNYYDDEVSYEVNTPVSDLASWAVVKGENEDGQIVDTRLQLNWVESSKYNKTKTHTDKGYTTMYTEGLKDIQLEAGQALEVHIIYRVKRDAEGPLMDIANNDSGKDNVIEINAYKTYKNGKIEGRIDTDSNPGNAVPNDINTHEDDTEKAPYFKLVFDEGKNVIEGNVWEDLRTETLDNNQIIGNGIRETNEPVVGGVKVELIEIFKNKETEEEIQRVVREATTAYTSDGTVSDGGYRFENVPGGIYRIKFTYGLKEQLSKDIRYNGHDYKATVINGEITQETTKKEAKAEIILTIDTSGSMSGRVLKDVQRAAIQLVNDLFDNQEDLKIGVVEFNSDANVRCSPTNNRNLVKSAINELEAGGGTNIADGINTTAGQFTEEEGKNKIMVLFTDGMSNVTASRDALINAADNQGIYPISILTSRATDIFGTEDNPTRGKTYLISSDEIYNTFTEMVYGDIQDVTYITANRSYGSDVEIQPEITVGEKSRTRVQNIQYSEIMVNKNGTVLDAPRAELENTRIDIAYIETLTGQDKETAIAELAANTYMTAVTDRIKVNPNNNSSTGQTNNNVTKVGSEYIRQVNLGLTERPHVEMQTDEEIVGIQMFLADGTLLIDTENELKNYVNWPKPIGGYKLYDEKMPITINIDNELQQGSTIKIKYKITVTNTGEVDTYGSYFAYDIDDVDKDKEAENKETISTSAQIVYSYVNQNMAFRQEDNPHWNVVTDKDILSKEVQKSVDEQKCTVIQTQSLSTPLYPEVSKEVENGQKPSSVSTTLILSKVISSQDTTDTLTYDNSIEIVQRYNKVGRRDYIGVPGNYEPNSDIVEYDSAKAETVSIIPPFGEQKIYYMLSAIIISIIALSVVLIKKYVLGRKNAL